MPRIRYIVCDCGFQGTDGHWPDGRCPDCNRASTRAGTTRIRVEDHTDDPAAWLRTGWAASIAEEKDVNGINGSAHISAPAGQSAG